MQSEAEPGVMWMEMTMGTRRTRRSHKTTTTTARTRDELLLHHVRSEKDGAMLRSAMKRTSPGTGKGSERES